KLAKAKHETGRWGRDLHAELKRLKSGHIPQSEPQPNLTDPATFNINAPQSDIAEQFAKSVGFSGAQELISEWQQMQAKLAAANQFAARYEDEQLAERFIMDNPDFPGTPEANEILARIMDSSDLDWSKPENLGLAHQHAIRKGLYRPLTPDDIQAGTRGNSSQRTAPPQPPPGNAPTSDDIGNPWAMATDELRKRVLERGGLGKALLEKPAGLTRGS